MAVALLAFVMPAIVSVHFSGGSSLKLDKGLYPRVPDQQSSPVIPSAHRGSVAPDIPVEIAALLDRVLKRTFQGRSSTECCDSAGIKTIEVPVISEESDQYGVPSEADSDSASAQALGRRVWAEPRISPGNTSCHVIQVERDCCDLQQLDLWVDSTENAAGDAPDLTLMQIRERGRREESSPRLSGDLCFKAQARRKKYRSVKYKGEWAVRQCVVNCIVRWIQFTTVWGNCPSFTNAISSKYLEGFSNFWIQQHNAWFQPWNEAYFWMHPPNALWEQCVPKLKFDGARGVAIQPVRKDWDWWWEFGEVVLDWIDIPQGSPLFEDAQGNVHTTKAPYRIALFDAFRSDAEGEAWGDPDDIMDRSHSVPAYRTNKNTDDWDPPPQRQTSLHSQVPSGHERANCSVTQSTSDELLRSHSESESDCDGGADTAPDTSNSSLSKECGAMKRKKKRDQATRERRETPAGSSGMHSDSAFDSTQGSVPYQVHGNSLKHMLIKPNEHAGVSFSHRMKPRGRTQLHSGWDSQPERNIESVISADEDWTGCEDLKDMIMSRYQTNIFESINTDDVTTEAQAAREPHAKVRLTLKERHAGPGGDKPIRAVGPKESALYDKVVGFKKKGMLRKAEGDPQGVARTFLVPKLGGKWQLVIDYRHLNSCLERKNFPLPVIEDQLANEQGNFLFSLIDLEDGFHQMHLEEDSKHLTAFGTPFRVFEWNVLPMGVNVGPAVYQEMVQHVTRNCPSPQPYIDDIMSSNGKEILDPQKTTLAEKQEPQTLHKYFEAHTEKRCALFDALAATQLTVKPEKCHLFKKRVQYVGHILQSGQIFPSPAKTEAVAKWDHRPITTAKQLKGFLGLLGWYQV